MDFDQLLIHEEARANHPACFMEFVVKEDHLSLDINPVVIDCFGAGLEESGS